ncbi:hypothetical protein glysoja_045058 [Glycine soja]|uniref:Uncharacterized protein n=1 Tax=Glycine soja TaxID=3848 RepID=A0A0B2QRY8_GLYSO|nr:hypothetical protein glysoja_045058 [Glycine soja]
MVKQGSYYSILTLDDEVQSHYQLGNIGKPLHSMNLDEVSRSMDTPLKQQPSLGENLENFLAPAGVINVGDHQDHNVNVVIGGDTHHQDLMGMDPMVMPSQQEHWLQMQIPLAINIHQH